MRTPRSLAIVGCVPIILSIALAAQAPDRSHPPQPGPPPTLSLPTVQKRQLSNGLPVQLVELHEVPLVQVNLLVSRGSADDPSGRFGIASLTASMLEEGADSRSALEIADAVDFLGADLGTASGIDSTVVRLHVPVSRLGEALPIMADIATRPTFPSDELERLRQERLVGLLQARDRAPTIASIAFQRVLYGPTYRFGTPVFGTAATIKSFKTDDLRGFYASRFRPGNAALIVVGDVLPEKVMPLLETSFGSWKAEGTGPAQAQLTEAQEPARREVYLVDKPGAAQSEIRTGWIGVPRSTPDFFPILVMNTILGGSFTSRLNMNLREKHGYAYGADSSFSMYVAAGPFTASAAVQSDKTTEALKEFFNELNGMLQPVPAEELARAKNYVALRFPGGFETTGDISRRLEELALYRLPDDYYAKYVPNIQAVTAADVQRVAQKYIQPARFVVVVVGDLKAIEPGIRALNLGAVKVLSLDDVFGPAPTH
jgi:predicted Zn-dependent peptidase